MSSNQLYSHPMNYRPTPAPAKGLVGNVLREIVREASARLDGLNRSKIIDYAFAIYVGAHDAMHSAKKALKAI